MNKERIWKLLLLALVLCLMSTVLSGCIMDPDKNQGTQPTATWKRYTVSPSENPSTPLVNTPTPTVDPGTQSWLEDFPSPGVNNTVGVGIATPVTQVTASIPAATATPVAGSTLLKKGMQGDAVANVQAELKRLGYFEGKTDGDFGDYTENAVKKFQEQCGLPADGVVGPATLAKLSSGKAPTAPPEVTPTPTKKVTATPKVENVYLEKGNSGSKVTQMQTRLIELGYMAGSASGKVCSITEQAIIAFQQRNGLSADGVAGPSTLDKLYSSSARSAKAAVGVIGVTLKEGSEGAAVRLLQSKLKAYGFLSGSVDGSFGTATKEAVRAFQKANGLTADGKAGGDTLQKLFAGSVTTSSQSKATQKPTTKPTAKPTTKPTATKKATSKPTATPNAYIRVTERPDGEYFTLEKGMMGTPVKELQRALKKAGFFSGEVDGYFGDDTVTAVKKFQKSKGLKQDGKAGPATLRYLYEGDYPDLA